MRRTNKKSLVLFMMLVLAMTIFFGSSASAKSVIVKRSSFSKSENTMSNRAAIVKTGTTTLKLKESAGNSNFYGTIKFKVPKSGNYYFTFTEFKQEGTENVKGTIKLWKPISGKLSSLTFTTNGGKTNIVKIATKSESGSVTGSKYLKKRTAKLALKKNDTIYFSIKFPGSAKATMKFNTKCSTAHTSENTDSGTVYYTPSGEKYHSTQNCPTLSRSKIIYSTTVSGAEARDLDACKVCH